MPFVSRAVLLYQQAAGSGTPGPSETDLYERLREAPLDEFPVEVAREYLRPYAAALDELSRAERRMLLLYDLRLNELSVSEATSLLLPELQQARGLARKLEIRVRLAVAEGRWEDAVGDLRVGFRLAEATGHSTDFLVGRLVGFAIAGLFLQCVEEAVQSPDCPNLYWALATLPEDRLFETRTAIETELSLFDRLTGATLDFPGASGEMLGPDAARVLLDRWAANAAEVLFGRAVDPAALRLQTGLYVAVFADTFRQLLAEHPDWAGRAEQLSPAEVMVWGLRYKFERLQHGTMTKFYLPKTVRAAQSSADDPLAEAGEALTDPVTVLIRSLWPAVQASEAAARRSRQSLHRVLTLEAIRMHAATHDELPASLNELDPVPAWNDPVTGQPFEYERTSSTTATLTHASEGGGRSPKSILVELRAAPLEFKQEGK